MNTNANVKMQINRVSHVSRDDQLSIISVHSFDADNIAGLFSNNLYGKELPFGNLMTMLLMIEDCMNTISWPQQMADYRKMNKTYDIMNRKKSLRGRQFQLPAMNTPPEWKDKLPLATFGVRILFRTISGWQGVVQCLETGHRKKFISDLELIMFIIDELKNQSH